MKFDLDKQLIQIKFDNTITNENFIVNLLGENNFKIINRYSVK